MSMCTFQFKTKKSFDKVACALLDTPFHFSTAYGEIHYNLPRCITVWGNVAIDNVRNACKDAGISYLEV